jgi:hypothetical protein
MWVVGLALILAAVKIFVAFDKHVFAVSAREEAAMAKAKGVDISGREGIVGFSLSADEARVLHRPVRLNRLATTLLACVVMTDLAVLLVATAVWLWHA